ncbi:sigma-70 family RNA polymerase sigma factor [soil metagenome]
MEAFVSNIEEMRREGRPNDERTNFLLHEYREKGDPQAVEELLAAHDSLLRHIVLRHARSSDDSFDDLMQVGYVGLLKAVWGYESGSGARFATYAYSMIDGEIRRHHRDTRIVKRPRWAHSFYAEISKATTRLTEKHGRPPTTEEISAEANVSPEGLHQVMRLFHETDAMSLEEQPDLSEVRSLRRESFALPIEDRIVLEQALDSLSELQRQVVYLFFYKDLTQTEIGKSLGMSQRKVSHTIASATKSLRGFFGVHH